MQLNTLFFFFLNKFSLRIKEVENISDEKVQVSFKKAGKSEQALGKTNKGVEEHFRAIKQIKPTPPASRRGTCLKSISHKVGGRGRCITGKRWFNSPS